jgi:hypothetical protein
MPAAKGEGRKGRTAHESTLLSSSPYKTALEVAKHENVQKGVRKRHKK